MKEAAGDAPVVGRQDQTAGSSEPARRRIQLLRRPGIASDVDPSSRTAYSNCSRWVSRLNDSTAGRPKMGAAYPTSAWWQPLGQLDPDAAVTRVRI
jgi:hypothetical protein